MIKQKIVVRESCAAIARPGSGSDPGETCALWVQSFYAPQAQQSEIEEVPQAQQSEKGMTSYPG
ncbi:hypothetical protein JOD24_002630 [Kroppenstedtia sanguinis]|uniref:Uncharacterized protein n=1 Tax=Kroppenstedtia sanguinis TaxID=1380684 RepID=A0ABW4CAA6_9BACL